MKNNVYLLSKLFFVLLLVSLLPFSVFAQSLAPIPDVGEGVCISNCPSDTPTTFPLPEPEEEDEDISSEASDVIEALETDIQYVVELDDQALQEINEGNYIEAGSLIDSAIESLTDVRDSLNTEPELTELRDDEPKAVSKIDKGLKSSINSHKRASSAIEKINTNPTVEENESLLSKFIKKTKKYLRDGRRHTQTTSIAVAGVRG
jgi:hypothetical protein